MSTEEIIQKWQGYGPVEVANYLEGVCNHHDHGEGWVYSRKAVRKIKHVRFEGDLKKHLTHGVKWHLKSIFGRKAQWEKDLLRHPGPLKDRLMGWLGRATYHIKAIFKMEDNLPDGAAGTIRNGAYGMDAITFWEEDGEIIEAMGPTVGMEVAAFLRQEPGHPAAIAISDEIKRISILSVKENTQ